MLQSTMLKNELDAIISVSFGHFIPSLFSEMAPYIMVASCFPLDLSIEVIYLSLFVKASQIRSVKYKLTILGEICIRMFSSNTYEYIDEVQTKLLLLSI